ncbi:hypothetical protein ABPG72_006664 [Tetrahymena utriculariae]
MALNIKIIFLKYFVKYKKYHKAKKIRQNNNKIITNSKIDQQNLKNNQTLLFQNNNLIINKETKVLSEYEQKRVQLVKKSLLESRRNISLDQNLVFKLCYSHPQIVNNLLQSTDQNQNLQYFNQNKLFNNIKISTDQLFSKMVQNYLKIQFQGNNLKISDFSKEYDNIHSRFIYCLNVKVVSYLLILETRKNIVYSYLKEYSKRQRNFTKNDWYKTIVQIEPTKELDCSGVIIPFSNIIVNESSIINCLKHLDLYNSQDQPFNEIWQNCISSILLKQALIFDSLGLLSNNINKGKIEQSQGESIFIPKDEILILKLNQNYIQKALNLQYQRLPISKQQHLPNWIQLDCKSARRSSNMFRL